MLYKCIIIDDEPLARELLEGYVQQVPFLQLEQVFPSAIEASLTIHSQTIDLIFLDIEMPRLSGLDFLRNLKQPPAIIFTTAYAEYALNAFNLNVVDYLLKPIEFNRFFQAVNKVIKSVPQTITPPEPHQATLETTKEDEAYFFIKTDQKIVKVLTQDILFIEGLQKYVKIHLPNEILISLTSLSHLLEKLPSDSFTRIHRSYIINIAHIDSIQGNTITIQKHHLPLSQGNRSAFYDLIASKRLDG
ncbi:LytR/AlgR family response regulator transcription factor [Microscilla marina]|uniref:Two-component system response regulator protein n=1 Tax=Microscilla marina ATCC 23134 TaxID=313606 RepID=A1ZK58_MICM2|nr:LytTR family DNA-binding domain-containing protein [Microscilla marina]EAY29084.1 two-component system response regulator protein [Microscilla marina ATCC 23134]